MEKPLHKRRQTKQFQAGHEADRKGLKQSNVKKDDSPKNADHNDSTHKINTNTGHTSRDSSSTKLSSSTTYRETHISSSRVEHPSNQPSRHSATKKALKNGKEHDRPQLSQSGRPTQSHGVERAPITGATTNTARDVHSVDTPKNAKLLSTRQARLEESVVDGSHDNRAFEPDDGSKQICREVTIQATASQSQLSKCIAGDDIKMSANNTQRLDSMSPYRSKYSQGHTVDHFSEMNEIARYNDINYGSCTFVDHPQHRAESVPTDLFHHDDVIGAIKASQNGGSAEKTEHRETADKMSVCEVYLQQPNICSSDLNDVVFHPVPLSPQPNYDAQMLESSQTFKIRKLPAITMKNTEGSVGTTRTHGRSNSLIPFEYPNSELRSAVQSSRTVGRSQSMRIPSTSESARPRKLLRELSLADADTTALRNYGALRGKNSLPKRQSSASMKREATIQEEDSDKPKISSEVKSHLLNLMQELLVRGKINQVGILDQETATLMLSLPAWNLRKADIMGLIKAAGNTQEIMFKLTLDKVTYSCFKHDPNKIVGRAEGKILVAQKTHTCVVVGIAAHDTPGSCLYEVAELANSLMEKDW